MTSFEWGLAIGLVLLSAMFGIAIAVIDHRKHEKKLNGVNFCVGKLDDTE